jgi:hypothetical protein
VSVACLKTSCRLPIRICTVLREMATRSKSARITGTSYRLEPRSGATDRYQVPLELWPKFCGSPSAVPTIIRIKKKELEIWTGARTKECSPHLPWSLQATNPNERRSRACSSAKAPPTLAGRGGGPAQSSARPAISRNAPRAPGPASARRRRDRDGLAGGSRLGPLAARAPVQPNARF